MKYAVDMGAGVMIHTSSFIKIGSGFHKLMTEARWGYTNSKVISYA
jgi:hypothetical protein